jgi:hypothetical protein
MSQQAIPAANTLAAAFVTLLSRFMRAVFPFTSNP